MPKNKPLKNAHENKDDEYYTQYKDIEMELGNYESHFKGKTIYCNCDDPTISAFFTYFSRYFNILGLKRLITTCYQSDSRDLFSRHDKKHGMVLDYTAPNSEMVMPNLEDIKTYKLKGDGAYDSDECIELLEQADIVVTNPPFSLFSEFVPFLITRKKKFLVIGPMSAISYQDIFPLIKSADIRFGYKRMGTDMLFNVPENFAKKLIVNKKEGEGYKIVNGVVMGRASAIWYTNLSNAKKNEKLHLVKWYDEDKYPEYDNYNAINVNYVAEIPRDYPGVMGVPISFLDKFNPKQFEIIGSDYDVKNKLLPHMVKHGWKGKLDRGVVGGARKFARILIKNKNPERKK